MPKHSKRASASKSKRQTNATRRHMSHKHGSKVKVVVESNEQFRQYVTYYCRGDKANLPEDLRDVRIGLWDVSDITDMQYLFTNTDFNEDISEWTVDNVENMDSMFAICEVFNQDISKWNVSKVKNMMSMFSGCLSFNQDISKWKVGKVENMAAMFDDCKKFNSQLNEWDVSNVVEMEAMFMGCSSFNQPLNKWNVTKVKKMNYMFDGCVNFNQPLNLWDVSKVKSMIGIFGFDTERESACKNMDPKHVSNWELKGIDYTYGVEEGEGDEDEIEENKEMMRDGHIIGNVLEHYNRLTSREKKNLKKYNIGLRVFETRKQYISAFDFIDKNVNKVQKEKYKNNLSKYINPNNFNTHELLSYIDTQN